MKLADAMGIVDTAADRQIHVRQRRRGALYKKSGRSLRNRNVNILDPCASTFIIKLPATDIASQRTAVRFHSIRV